MKIAVVQFSPVIGNLSLTIKSLDLLIEECKEADLVVLPELANSGYGFASLEEAYEYAENTDNSKFVNFLFEKCRKYNLKIVSGFNEKEGDKLYNSAILVGEKGLLGKYRKLHLFMNEKNIFQPGNTGLPVFEIENIKVGMLICFDWMFPEVWRIMALKGADIICHPANLVLPLAQKALPCHAITNRIFIATANRIGTEREVTFTGNSMIVNTKGDILYLASPDKEECKVADISIEQSRDKNVTPDNNIFSDRRNDCYDLKCFS
ncbi:MAG: hypothetical protein PHD97_04325 [Bacteroidales bacterium]|nr:hypothetical protein [Bacteroidales bacterium]